MTELTYKPPNDQDAMQLLAVNDAAAMMAQARQLRDEGYPHVVTYSRKVFLPLTELCRDVCHYCTFAKTPGKLASPYMTVDEVIAQAQAAEVRGCKEALLTLGEKPELRYRIAREALATMGFSTTLEYVAHVAGKILQETSLLPHINAGCMTDDEIDLLRPVSASMGLMLESASDRLCEKGMPHYGSPDKVPAVRLDTIERAGRKKVPFTSGILIGIGETRRERIDALLALRRLHQRYGHLQEIIIQNFRAKPGTKMANASEPDIDELLWTVAVSRILFAPSMSIQVPPNLSPGELHRLIDAGINDWGGVSPVTPDFVNPEAPWPHLVELAARTAACGKHLQERLTVYPQYVLEKERWLNHQLHTQVLRMTDAEGLPRIDAWTPGVGDELPDTSSLLIKRQPDTTIAADLTNIVVKARAGEALTEREILRLFQARGSEFSWVCHSADELRAERCGNAVGYVVNRNINYTNVCYYKCRFCAFSKGKTTEELRGAPYDISLDEIGRRCSEAWERGATEVCMQGGINPNYTGETYLDILRAVTSATPAMHIHAFSPLEVWQGAQTLGLSITEYLQRLQDAGLATLPGTAAEILDDEVRATLCADKINTDQWLEVMRTAHEQGLRSTATIMFGHIDRPQHWARHLLRIRQLQEETGGFTEFVPLPFVPMEAPIYKRGLSRRGPTFREAVLMHAVSRLALNPVIDNVQASWVKMGRAGVVACLQAGANDIGGTLMNESITRAAGSAHGQECSPESLEAIIAAAGRSSRQRTTLYSDAPVERQEASYRSQPLAPVVNEPFVKASTATGVLSRSVTRGGSAAGPRLHDKA